MIGAQTIGNATLIAYDQKPILSTDPWMGGDHFAYFAHWGPMGHMGSHSAHGTPWGPMGGFAKNLPPPDVDKTAGTLIRGPL